MKLIYRGQTNTSSKVVFFLPIGVLLVGWFFYLFISQQWYLFFQNWLMPFTMVLGSFIAGATPEGGGAVAFPVMTLIFKISPDVARNFSLAIQSFGMSAATYLIIVRRIPIETTYLFLCALGGTWGVIFGSYIIAPMIAPPYAKMLFVTLWLSFGVVLFWTNFFHHRRTVNKLPPLSQLEKNIFVLIGFLGGIISAIVGSGIDMSSFAFTTSRYHLSEKVATSTSVCLMAIISVVGFFTHGLILRDFGLEEFQYLLTCIPIVMIGAPLGAYFISGQTQQFITNFLYLVLLVQFVGAYLIIKPRGLLLWFSLGVFILGIFLFSGFMQTKKSTN